MPKYQIEVEERTIKTYVVKANDEDLATEWVLDNPEAYTDEYNDGVEIMDIEELDDGT